MWMAFTLHNITSNIHTSSVTLYNAYLIWYISKGNQVDISKIISNKIWEIIGSQQKHILKFLGLIMNCVSNPMWTFLTTIVSTWCHNWIVDLLFRYCTDQRRRVPEPPTVQTEQQFEITNFDNMDPNPITSFTCSWDTNDAYHKYAFF